MEEDCLERDKLLLEFFDTLKSIYNNGEIQDYNKPKRGDLMVTLSQDSRGEILGRKKAKRGTASIKGSLLR
jgi:hypothetical protein